MLARMRYFTRGWINGEYSEEDHDASWAAYAARLDEISGQLPAAMIQLAKESLHDAVIDCVTWDPAAQRLTLVLAVERATGHVTMTLTYAGALLGESRVEVLRAVARDRQTEILYSEVDRDSGGLLAHRLLFWPRDELTIDFASLTLEVTERADLRVFLSPSFIEVDEAK